MHENLDGKRVLVVEDDQLIAMMVEEILDMQNAQVVLASTVAAALAAIAEHRLDVGILDVNLHGNASWPVAEELRRRDIPYLVVSGYGDSLDRELAPRILAKPYAMPQLLDALSEMLPP